MEQIVLIVGVIGAFIGSQWIQGVVVAWFNRGKVKADASAELTGAAIDLVKSTSDRLRFVEKDLQEAKKTITEIQAALFKTEQQVEQLTKGINILSKQVKDLGHTPAWVPPWAG